MKTTTRRQLKPEVQIKPAAQPPLMPAEEDVRDYAYHLYEQGGRIPGNDIADWLEAEACLKANVPRQHSRTRLHRHLLGLGAMQQAELCEETAAGRSLALGAVVGARIDGPSPAPMRRRLRHQQTP